MEWYQTVTGIVTLVNSIMIGGGGLLFFRANKRKANAEAQREETNNAIAAGNEWQELAMAERQENKRLNELLDERWKDKMADREIIFNLMKGNNEKDLKIQMLEIKACNRRGCQSREPQTGY